MSTELRALVREFLEDNAPVRAEADPKLYTRFAGELGMASLPVAEEHGGAGATWVEVAVVLEETGRALLRGPYLSSVVAGSVLQQVGATEHLAGLADGTLTAALALDGTDQVVDADGADLVLLAGPDGLSLLERPATTALATLDVTRPQARVDAGGAAARVGDAQALAYARDLLHVGLAAESVGLARRVLEMTVGHLKVREQFGRPLGSFQALRHRVADLTVELDAATSSVWYAARAASGSTDDLPVAAPLALAAAGDVACRITGEAIQLHGGIGFTWEHDLHLFFKRAWTTAVLHGNGHALRRTAFERSGT